MKMTREGLKNPCKYNFLIRVVKALLSPSGGGILGIFKKTTIRSLTPVMWIVFYSGGNKEISADRKDTTEPLHTLIYTKE